MRSAFGHGWQGTQDTIGNNPRLIKFDRKRKELLTALNLKRQFGNKIHKT